MSRILILKLLLAVMITVFPVPPVKSQTAGRDSYLSIDQVTDQLKSRFGIQFFYNSKWFEKRNFHFSILELPFAEALDRILRSADLSVVTIDSVLYVFVPLNISPQIPVSGESADVLIIGNPSDYGKYARATIQGRILDGKNGSPLPGASVLIDKLKQGTRTDEKGYYQFQAPVGEYTVRMSFLGYEENKQKIKLVANGSLNAELFEKSVKLDEIVISSQRAELNVTGTQMSIIKLDSKAIRELPVTLGETDVIKSITLMPGVQTIGEFGTGFNVRGGGADQNLILIEDTPLFNSSHLFGLISVVNSDGIVNITLLKAGIPAKYGERASSVLDIQMGAGNPAKTSVKGGIGIINSRIYIETPLINKKISLLTGARSSYSNLLLHQIPDIDLMNSSARFYDVNALLSYTLNSSNKLSFFGYSSNDKFGVGAITHYRYNNLLASLRWKHSFNDNFYFNFMTGMSRYRFEVSESDSSRPWNDYAFRSNLLYENIKWNFTWLPDKIQAIDFGINAAFYNINPGELSPVNKVSIIKPQTIHNEKGAEYAAYFSDNITLSRKLVLDVGLRYSLYEYVGPNIVYAYQPNASRTPESIIDSMEYGNNKPICWYGGFEPRFSVRFSLSEQSSIKFSYNRIHQYINQVSNTAIMSPSDIWKLSSPNLKPLTCDHIALGYFRNFKNNALETSVEVYYKRINNAIEYRNGAKIVLNPYLETELLNVKGKNVGIEFYVRKNDGRLTGWASYTFSRSLQKTNGLYEEDKINNNQWFPSNYDRPDNLVLNANYHISKRWRFGTTFTYSTGRPATLPELKFGYQGYQLLYYSDRNKYRLPDYHRLDLSITLDESLRIRKKWKGSWTFSIINVYGRKNAYSVFYKKEDHLVSYEYKQYDTYMLYIIGRPLPTITYNFIF